MKFESNLEKMEKGKFIMALPFFLGFRHCVICYVAGIFVISTIIVIRIIHLKVYDWENPQVAR